MIDHVSIISKIKEIRYPFRKNEILSTGIANYCMGHNKINKKSIKLPDKILETIQKK